MDNTLERNSSAADTSIVSVGSDVNFGRSYGGRPRRVFARDQNSLAAILRCEYRDYEK